MKFADTCTFEMFYKCNGTSITRTSLSQLFDNSNFFFPPTDLSYQGSTVYFLMNSKLLFFHGCNDFIMGIL